MKERPLMHLLDTCIFQIIREARHKILSCPFLRFCSVFHFWLTVLKDAVRYLDQEWLFEITIIVSSLEKKVFFHSVWAKKVLFHITISYTFDKQMLSRLPLLWHDLEKLGVHLAKNAKDRKANIKRQLVQGLLVF